MTRISCYQITDLMYFHSNNTCILLDFHCNILELLANCLDHEAVIVLGSLDNVQDAPPYLL